VRIFPHSDEALAVIEVTVLALDDLAEEEVARLAVPLHRLNHEARFEHAWIVVIDDHSGLNVTTTVAVADTRANTLTGILYDGIDRASALTAVVSGILSAAAADPEEPEPTPASGAGVIRG
jgi:hypothetical protein